MSSIAGGMTLVGIVKGGFKYLGMASEDMEPLPSEPHFLDDPEVRKVFTDVLNVVVAESDRGAVLVATSIVDQHLRLLFERRLPPDMQGKKAKKQLLSYGGPLGTLAAKTDVARATGLIGRNTYDAIQLLRSIRNHVAHSPESFRLSDHRKALWEMCQLGEGLPQFINRTAGEFLVGQVVERLRDLHIEIPSEEPKRAFNSPREIFEHL